MDLCRDLFGALYFATASRSEQSVKTALGFSSRLCSLFVAFWLGIFDGVMLAEPCPDHRLFRAGITATMMCGAAGLLMVLCGSVTRATCDERQYVLVTDRADLAETAMACSVNRVTTPLARERRANSVPHKHLLC